MLPAEHIYAATTMSKVNHLLPGNAARRNTHAFVLDAMIAA